MTVIHIVCFKFQPTVSNELKAIFVTELKKLKSLPCVQHGRLIVGGPSITDPIIRSKGFEFALVSYHKDRQALAEYQASKEHHHVTSTHMFPYKEDLFRFDFEVDPEDEGLCSFNSILDGKPGVVTPQDRSVLRFMHSTVRKMVDFLNISRFMKAN